MVTVRPEEMPMTALLEAVPEVKESPRGPELDHEELERRVGELDMGQAGSKTADLQPIIGQRVPNSPRSKRDIPHSARCAGAFAETPRRAFHSEMECCRRVRRIRVENVHPRARRQRLPVTGLQADEQQGDRDRHAICLLHGAVTDRVPWRCL